MSTDKPRLQGYVEHDIWVAFQGYQLKHALSQSQALESLLAQALGLEKGNESIQPGRLEQLENATKAQYMNALQQIDELRVRIEALEEVPLLSELLYELPSEPLVVKSSELLYELPSEPLVVKSSELLYELPSEPLTVESMPLSELPDEPPSEPQGVTQSALARRLGKSHTAISKHRQQGDLLEWSRAEDPEQVGWRFDLGAKLYYPAA